MKSQQVLILASGVVLASVLAFVGWRFRNPPPPPPPDALVVVPGKRLGPFSLGMPRAEAEAKRAAGAASAAPASSELLIDGGVRARLRDGKVVSVSATVGKAGVALDGAWIPAAADAPRTVRSLAGSLRGCLEKKRAGGARFECYGTRFDADAARDEAVITIGTEIE